MCNSYLLNKHDNIKRKYCTNVLILRYYLICLYYFSGLLFSCVVPRRKARQLMQKMYKTAAWNTKWLTDLLHYHMKCTYLIHARRNSVNMVKSYKVIEDEFDYKVALKLYAFEYHKETVTWWDLFYLIPSLCFLMRISYLLHVISIY